MRSLTTILVLLTACAGPVLADPTWDDLAGAQGTYEGRALSGGVMVAVETRLEAMPDGTLQGTYSFVQDGKIYWGTLIHGRVAGPMHLVFIWHDDWGFGTITLDFAPDFSSFVAAWAPLDDTSDAFPWVGRRQDSGG